MSDEKQLGMTQEQLEQALDHDAANKVAQAPPRLGLRIGEPEKKPIPLTRQAPTPKTIAERLHEDDRFRFAGQMAQALLTSAGASMSDAQSFRLMVQAVALADKLMAELAKPPKPTP